MRRASLIGPLLWLAIAPASAHAVPRPFDLLDCVPRDGLRFCEGSVDKRVGSFDGVPIDANVTLPGEGEGPWPLIIEFHGYAGQKRGFDDTPPHEGPKRLASRGFAVLHHTSRGFGGSCGTLPARLADPSGCATGWLRLDDVRYEVRDAQWLAGLLVDQGIVDPRRIGAFADSYGGAPSLMLALLRDRVMLPDGRYAPWRSPRGTSMQLRAAAPYQTWSDLPNALTPNGRALDYTVPVRSESTTPIGAIKGSFVAGLYVTGQVSVPGFQLQGYYAPPGLDPDANLSVWLPRLLAGEPFDGDPVVADVADEMLAHHSPLWLEMDREPAPLLLSAGGSDDLFTPLEMLRVRNLVQSKFPRATIGFWLGDFGHQRGANKEVDIEARQQRILAWLDFYVRGVGKPPFRGLEVRTQRCPKAAPSLGPFTARRWSELRPGEVRASFPGPASISSVAGDLSVSAAVDPVAAGNTPCARVPADDQGAGVATFRLPPAPVPWTMIGSPTVLASFDVTGSFAQVAGRLWDVAPDGTQVLVSRGVLRPRGGSREPFQLAPNAYRFEPGHVAKLELLGQDAPFLRPSNGAFTAALGEVELRLPVHERPDGGSVGAPAAPLLPAGAAPAPDLAPPAAVKAKRRRRDLRLSVRCLPGRRVRAALVGADTGRVRSLRVRGRLDRRPPYRMTFRRTRARRISARVVLRDGRRLTLTRRAPRCR